MSAMKGADLQVPFSLAAETPFQSRVLLVGSIEALGAWNPDAGVELRTTPDEYPQWSATVRIPADTCAKGGFEYKFVIVRPDLSLLWEELPNRRVRSARDLPSSLRFGEEDLHLEPHQEAAFASEPCHHCKVTFEVNCAGTFPGDSLLVMGASKVLGMWEPARALHLTTLPSMFPTWFGTVSLDPDNLALGAWKLAILRADGTLDWEHIQDRHTAIASGEPEEAAVSRCPRQAWIIRVEYDGEASEPVLHGQESAEELNEWPISRRYLALRAPAAACIELISECRGLQRPLVFDHPQSLWVLDLAETVVGEGVHEFSFRVDGRNTVSDCHPAHSSRDCNVIYIANGVWSCVGTEHGAAVQSEALVKGTPSTDCDVEEARVLRKGAIARPSSTASTASTCTNEDECEELLNLARPFSPEVFEGLFDEDLRQRLSGLVVPEPADNRSCWLWAAAHRLEKSCGRCEDAFFHSTNSLGVADGVGSMVQFAKYGADAAAYAAELMNIAAAALRPDGCAANMAGNATPDARAAAALAAAEAEAQTYGASTMTVLSLEGNKVGVANLGDSGFMLLRKAPKGMSVIARSSEQQHHWNCPYQLARLPPALTARLPQGQRLDTAADCQRYVVSVQPGDLLLLYTDGLIDNIHEHELLQIADRALGPTLGSLAGFTGFATPPECVARGLALAAQERSLDEGAAVPFMRASRRHGMDAGLGGKPDDITVVAAWVMPKAPTRKEGASGDH